VVISDRYEGLVLLGGGGAFADVTPPRAVTNLEAFSLSPSAIDVTWSAPGDDGLSGTAEEYDLRYSLLPIETEDDWEQAVPVDGEPIPSRSGVHESLRVTGLERLTDYHFGLKTMDAASNWSELSNIAIAQTTGENVVPVLTDAGVTPEVGTIDSVFVFELTYTDFDADPPSLAQVLIDGETYTMAEITDTYVTGALFRYETSLAVGPHSHSFRFSDGNSTPVTTNEVPDRPWVGTTIFDMGSPPDEPGHFSDELELISDEILHRVLLTREIWVSDHEVTQAEYEDVMDTNPSWFVDPDHPVENVSWMDAVIYCNELSADSGYTPAYVISGQDDVNWDPDADGFRLPTEAEWEWACRAGTQTAFATGRLINEGCGFDPVLDEIGWYCGNTESTEQVSSESNVKIPNAWGKFDMHGNVWEWCWDWYAEDLGSDFAVDPSGPATGSHRVARGGSWFDFARDARSASRLPQTAGSPDNTIGFRVVRTVR
jgi:formylglycine-generating enzyme required for sulfatase activity